MSLPELIIDQKLDFLVKAIIRDTIKVAYRERQNNGFLNL
jgi:hypothetical protein